MTTKRYTIRTSQDSETRATLFLVVAHPSGEIVADGSGRNRGDAIGRAYRAISSIDDRKIPVSIR